MKKILFGVFILLIIPIIYSVLVRPQVYDFKCPNDYTSEQESTSAIATWMMNTRNKNPQMSDTELLEAWDETYTDHKCAPSKW